MKLTQKNFEKKAQQVYITLRAKRQATEHLLPQQWAHIRAVGLRLTDFDPRLITDSGSLSGVLCDLDITQVHTFHRVYVLRDTGGVLGRSQVEVVFGQIPDYNEIVLLEFALFWSDLNASDKAYYSDIYCDYYYKRCGFVPRRIRLAGPGGQELTP